MARAAGFFGIPWKDDTFEVGKGMGLVETKEGKRYAGEDNESRPGIVVSTAAASTGEHSGIYSLTGLFLLDIVGPSPRPIPCNLCRLTPHGDGGESATSEDGAAALYHENACDQMWSRSGHGRCQARGRSRRGSWRTSSQRRPGQQTVTLRSDDHQRTGRGGSTGRRRLATVAGMEWDLRITINMPNLRNSQGFIFNRWIAEKYSTQPQPL